MRKPAAVGFYPSSKIELENFVKKCIASYKKINNPLGAIVPHAGYTYSGAVAGATLKSAETEKRNFFIFCPNHTGYGSAVASSSEDWQTPLGTVKVNTKITDNINRFLGVKVDESAHKHEHSAEVQLPFLQVLYKDFTIVPICFSFVELKDLERLAKYIASFSNDSFFIASSDFIHFGPMYGYVPAGGSVKAQLEWVKKHDMNMIEKICNLDAFGFYETVTENEYTVCGYVPITLLMLIMKNIGAAKGRLMKYMSSYDTQPNSSFVSYAGIVFE